MHSCWFLGAVHHVGRDCCVVLDQRLRYVFGVQMNKRKHEITGIGLSILLCKNKNPVAKVFGADMMLLTALSQTVWRGTPPFPSLLMPPLTQNPVSAPEWLDTAPSTHKFTLALHSLTLVYTTKNLNIVTGCKQWRIYHRVGGGGRPPHRYKMPPLLLNCRPPPHYDIHMNTTRVTVFPYSGDVIHSQLSGIVSTTVKIVIVICYCELSDPE